MYSFKALHSAIDPNRTLEFCCYQQDGEMIHRSYADFKEDYLKLAHFLSSIGMSKQSVIGIMGRTRYEWNVADCAVQVLSGITVGFYANDSAQNIKRGLDTTQPKIMIIEDYQQLKRLQDIDSDWGWEKPVIVMDSRHTDSAPIYHLNHIINTPLKQKHINILESKIEAIDEDLVCSYIFTSGTSGSQKAVALSQKNLFHTALTYHDYYPINSNDSTLLYLPMSHVFARVMFYASIIWGQKHVYLDSPDQLASAMPKHNPTTLLVVPRILDKIISTINGRVESASVTKRLLFNSSIAIGKRRNGNQVTWLDRALYPLADKLVLHKLRGIFGNSLRFIGAGGGHLNPQSAMFFQSIGLPVYEGYALTESGGLGIFNHPQQYAIGTIGKPTKNVSIKVSEQGELLINSPSNALGYFNGKDIEPIPQWLETGDQAEVNEKGQITIVDRLKDILVTSYGKNIAPSWIEDQFLLSPYIEDIVVIGDNRPYLTALIVQRSVDNDDDIKALLDIEIEKINASLARHEQIKAYALVPEFNVDNNLLTATFKKRRKAIESAFYADIERLYSKTPDTVLQKQPIQLVNN